VGNRPPLAYLESEGFNPRRRLVFTPFPDAGGHPGWERANLGPNLIPVGPGKEAWDAEVEVHGGTGRDGTPASGGGDSGGGDLSEAWSAGDHNLPWRKKLGGLGVPELRELRHLREENRRRKGLVADLSLDKEILQEAIRKRW